MCTLHTCLIAPAGPFGSAGVVPPRRDDVSGSLGSITAAIVFSVVVLGGLSLLHRGVASLPRGFQRFAAPLVFVGPAVGLLLLAYIGPSLLTLQQSLLRNSTGEFVGVDNYTKALTDPEIRQVILNTLLWLVVPVVCVVLGLLVAALTDRLSPGWERAAKTLIFLPMAISFVGASTIWSFVYAYQPPGAAQIGVLNQLTTMAGGQPVPWIIEKSFHLNTFLLMVIVIWMYVGFAMVALSAAIKGVPRETIEAARVDGATETQSFRHVVIPQIRGTIAVMITTIALLTLKVFDVVYSMTGGRFDTDVVGNAFYNLLFFERNRSRAAVLVVILLIMVLPIMVINLRRAARQTPS